MADEGLSPALKTIVQSNNSSSAFKDTYILDFLMTFLKNIKKEIYKPA